jgi:hypothetical protein
MYDVAATAVGTPHGGRNAPAAQALWGHCANAIVARLAGTMAHASRLSARYRIFALTAPAPS